MCYNFSAHTSGWFIHQLTVCYAQVSDCIVPLGTLFSLSFVERLVNLMEIKLSGCKGLQGGALTLLPLLPAQNMYSTHTKLGCD